MPETEIAVVGWGGASSCCGPGVRAPISRLEPLPLPSHHPAGPPEATGSSSHPAPAICPLVSLASHTCHPPSFRPACGQACAGQRTHQVSRDPGLVPGVGATARGGGLHFLRCQLCTPRIPGSPTPWLSPQAETRVGDWLTHGWLSVLAGGYQIQSGNRSGQRVHCEEEERQGVAQARGDSLPLSG